MPSNHDTTPQRRRSSRISFKTTARLTFDQQILTCTVIDLSIRGVLVTLEQPAPGLDVGAPCTLDLFLGDEDEHIRMKARLAHIEGEGLQLGLHCVEIDLDSVTTLRRLVELNLTDPEALERNLGALLESASLH